jgi:hypothetical protein
MIPKEKLRKGEEEGRFNPSKESEIRVGSSELLNSTGTSNSGLCPNGRLRPFARSSVRQDKPGAFSGCNSRPGKGKSRLTGSRVLGSRR